MLSPEYLDRLPEAVMKQIEDAELAIIRDMARRIAKAGEVTATAEWQLLKLQEMGAEQSFILGELRRTLELSDKELQELFIRAAEKTLETDDEIYRTAGYDPPPLKESPYAETVIRSGYIRTRGTFYNLTETTARTAGKQFERILDEGHLRLTSGAFSYQEVIRWGVKKLAEEGVKAIEYPSGHTDSLDTAYRRATLTGLNQAGLKLQEERMKEMGVEYVETTAHAGARPSHTVWQGRIFKLRGSDEKYDNFYTATGYGTGEGLGGWNCRHGFYPFFPGISEPANSEEYLRQLNEKSVKYNGEKMSMYEATQKQRYMERQIRRWKREYTGMEAAGQDTRESAMKLKAWREREYDFLRQTGLDRQKDREAVLGFGRSQAAKAAWTAKKYMKNLANSDYNDIIKAGIKLPKENAPLSNTVLQNTLNVDISTKGKYALHGVMPKGAELSNVRIIAGYGVTSKFRNAQKFADSIGGEADRWQKVGGLIKTNNYIYDLHWYQYYGSDQHYSYELKNVKEKK